MKNTQFAFLRENPQSVNDESPEDSIMAEIAANFKPTYTHHTYYIVTAGLLGECLLFVLHLARSVLPLLLPS